MALVGSFLRMCSGPSGRQALGDGARVPGGLRPDCSSVSLSVLCWTSRSAQLPALVPVESEVDEASQVEGGRPCRQSDLVAFHAAVADAAMSFGDEPGNRPFDHWSVLAVVVDAVTLAPSGSGKSEVFVVFGDGERLAADVCGASRTQRATNASRSEAGKPAAADGDRGPVRAGDRSSGVVNREVVAMELVRAEMRVPDGRPRLDHRGVPGLRTRNRPEPRARRVLRRAMRPRSGRLGCSLG